MNKKMNVSQKLDELNDQYHRLRRQIEDYDELSCREACPCCRQEVDRNYYKKQIPEIKEEMERIDKERKAIIPAYWEEKKQRGIKYDLEQKERWNRIKDYITKNRNKMNKAIRDYDKGVDNYLPDLSEAEKKQWNEAIEWHLDNRGLDDNEELCFEV